MTHDEQKPASAGPVSSGFDGLGIAPKLLEALDRLKLTTPTPIQLKAIPIALEGKDVMGIAQTGTGKTLAFGLPMIQRLAQVKGRGLIILPTRELALQVEEAMQTIGRSIGLRSAVLIGGDSMHRQLQALARKPHIIVATPGRLIDHLEQRTVKLDDVHVLVLDEADRMLDMGFAPQIKRILQTVPADRQTMLFSATMPNEIVGIARTYMKMPVRVEIAQAGTTADRVEQEIFFLKKEDKMRMLEKLLQEYKGTVLVFSRTKHGAKRITTALRAMGQRAAEIHSNRSLSQRREALDGFKSGRYRVLVATDIAARGIDVTGIELVLNFDLPDQAEDYVHRIGRTGRAGHAGHATSFATFDQSSDVRAIERLIRRALPVAKLPADLPAPRAMPYEAPEARSSGGYRDARRPSRPSRFGSTTGSSSYGRSSSAPSRYGQSSGTPSRYGKAPVAHVPSNSGSTSFGVPRFAFPKTQPDAALLAASRPRRSSSRGARPGAHAAASHSRRPVRPTV